jgi:N-acetylated-alpha-linked acidic dipeptidase
VLERFFNQIIEEVDDPVFSVTLKERRRAYDMLNGADDKAKAEARDRADLRIYPLGSGSDYTPFLQHLGIASANLGFGGEAPGGSYHTLYDTYEHFTTWKDPGLVYGATLARVTGRATLRLANAPRLPFEFMGLADNVASYVAEIEALADSMREETARTNQLIADGIYKVALNPNAKFGPPTENAPVPYFNFAPLKNALNRLEAAATAFDASSAANANTTEEINNLLYTSERLLTRDEGLEGRTWYKHHIYAPGFYTGYGVKTIPGVREAIEQREYEKVAPQIEIAAGVLNRMAERIELLSSKIGGE